MDSYGICWCVDREGNRRDGTQRRGVPRCDVEGKCSPKYRHQTYIYKGSRILKTSLKLV